ncbi:uncharacterized protein LOC111077313, partial [Drosophila obscura]|uniref:uncharacterized protein LOC111077313 n=1 Tax=Drosophila obscura TaxID=7282 RepID=UPI001BB1A587
TLRTHRSHPSAEEQLKNNWKTLVAAYSIERFQNGYKSESSHPNRCLWYQPAQRHSGNGNGNGNGSDNNNWENNGSMTGVVNNMMSIFNHAVIDGALYLHVLYVGETGDKWVTLVEAMHFCYEAVFAYAQLQLALFQNFVLDSLELSSENPL